MATTRIYIDDVTQTGTDLNASDVLSWNASPEAGNPVQVMTPSVGHVELIFPGNASLPLHAVVSTMRVCLLRSNDYLSNGEWPDGSEVETDPVNQPGVFHWVGPHIVLKFSQVGTATVTTLLDAMSGGATAPSGTETGFDGTNCVKTWWELASYGGTYPRKLSIDIYSDSGNPYTFRGVWLEIDYAITHGYSTDTSSPASPTGSSIVASNMWIVTTGTFAIPTTTIPAIYTQGWKPDPSRLDDQGNPLWVEAGYPYLYSQW